jgi:hypothetical protein
MALRRIKVQRGFKAAGAAVLVGAACCVFPADAHASFLGGVSQVAAGLVQLPLNIIAGTLSGPPLIGTVNGVLTGAVNTVALVGGGTVEVVGAVIPAVKQLGPWVAGAI